MSNETDFYDSYKQVEELLEEERTCHDDCMCNICIIKQQVWEMSSSFAKLQAELDKHRWIPVAEGLPKGSGGFILYEVLRDGHILERPFYKNNWLLNFSHYRQITLPEDEK